MFFFILELFFNQIKNLTKRNECEFFCLNRKTRAAYFVYAVISEQSLQDI